MFVYLQTSRSSNETSDSEITASYGCSTLDRDSRVGAISQEEAERKRVAFLRYLEQRFPHRAVEIEINTSQSVIVSYRGIYVQKMLACRYVLVYVRRFPRSRVKERDPANVDIYC